MNTNTSEKAQRTGTPRFGDLMAAEWIKIRSLRSNWAQTAFGVLFAAVAAWWQGRHVRVAPGAAASFNPLAYPYDQLTWGLMTVLAATFGALTLTGEYSSGLIRTTFVAVPARRKLLSAKSSVVALIMAAFGVAASLVSLCTAGAALSGQLTGLTLQSPAALRAMALSAALPVLGAQVGIALGALIRHPAATIALVWGLLMVLPTMLDSGTIGLADVTEAMPAAVWTALAHTAAPGARQGPLPAPGTAWVLIAAWPVLSLLLAAVIVDRQDV